VSLAKPMQEVSGAQTCCAEPVLGKLNPVQRGHRFQHLDRMGVPIHILSDGTLPIRSSAIEAVPLFPRPGFVQSAACGSFVAGPTTAIDELQLRARAHGRA
jgi:hypothetical protein